MTTESNRNSKNDFAERHQIAEAQLPTQQRDKNVFSALSPEKMHDIIHEQEVHKIELEMQNQELRRIQLELEVAHHQYIELYHSAPVGYLTIVQENNKIVQANQAAANLLGVEKNLSLINQSFTNFILPDDQHSYYFHCQEVIKTQSQLTCEIRLKQGETYFYAKLHTTVFQNVEDQTVHYLTVISDITEQKETEKLLTQRVEERTAELKTVNAELAYASCLKDEFLANMSHELRTPLNTILGGAEILQEQVFGSLNEQQEKTVRRIEKSGKQLLILITDILDLSKIAARQLELFVDNVSVDAVCQSSLQYVQEAAKNKQIKLSYSFDYAINTLKADRVRLKQILINLLINAIKFTPEGGVVELAAQGIPEEGVLELIVSDTGIGIAKEDFPKLFKPFRQLDGKLNRQYEGTGLGLSLVLSLTDMHGGSVSMSSKIGQGSCFTVTLPWLEETTEGSQEKRDDEKRDDVKTGDRHTTSLILVVDDHQKTIEMLFDYLVAKGYHVISASDGAEAIAQAQSDSPDLILMDIQMSGMDGLEAIKRIRADPKQASTPIIALTALVIPGNKERCLAAGANDYLSKPINLKQLKQKIKNLLPCSPDEA
ncbi:MAG: response regulator [Candidatus Parabeggiatoa sp.]|nr:response regulator [Candidatus Parabeggiatoa sp.]